MFYELLGQFEDVDSSEEALEDDPPLEAPDEASAGSSDEPDAGEVVEDEPLSAEEPFIAEAPIVFSQIVTSATTVGDIMSFIPPPASVDPLSVCVSRSTLSDVMAPPEVLPVASAPSTAVTASVSDASGELSLLAAVEVPAEAGELVDLLAVVNAVARISWSVAGSARNSSQVTLVMSPPE